jgi:hypothetical protein
VQIYLEFLLTPFIDSLEYILICLVEAIAFCELSDET